MPFKTLPTCLLLFLCLSLGSCARNQETLLQATHGRSLQEGNHPHGSPAGSILGGSGALARHSIEEEGHEHHEGEHTHEGAVVGHHPPHESPEEHMVEAWGAEGLIIEEELGYMFNTLKLCSSGDAGDHVHEGHGHGAHEEVVTPRHIIQMFGVEGALDEKALVNACPTLLNCQLKDTCSFLAEEEHVDKETSDVVMLKIVASIVLFVEVIVGGMVPVIVGKFEKLNMWHSLLNTFSGGIFMGAAFIHMLPEVQESQMKVEGLDGYPLGGAMVVVGFLFIFLIEHIICDTHSEPPNSVAPALDPQNPIKAVNVRAREAADSLATTKDPYMWGGLVLLLAISVHSLFESIALGLEEDKSSVLLLFATVGSHKGVAAMALSARFVRNSTPTKQVIMYVLLFALVAPVGIMACVWITGVSQIVLLVLDGLSAGTFIYIGAYEVISTEFGEKHSKTNANQYRILKYAAVVSGVFLIAMLQLIPHEHHH